MTPRRYTGLSPQRVSKDAKYTMTAGGSVRLEFQESQRVRILLTTDDHPELAEMVNAVKRHVNVGVEGGQFYINEFGDVLVPDGKGGPATGRATRRPARVRGGLATRQPVGPRRAGAWRPVAGTPRRHPIRPQCWCDRHPLRKGRRRRRETVYLSDFKDTAAVRDLARRLGAAQRSLGRPVLHQRTRRAVRPSRRGDWHYRYLGHLGEDVWFDPPEGSTDPESCSMAPCRRIELSSWRGVAADAAFL